jgi:hypothetical protein
MSGFVERIDRSQSTFFPAMLDDYVAEDNLVRAVDAFVEGLELGKLGFGRVAPLEKGRPSYHPATLLKIYIYGYLNRVSSSRRLERECQRNIELVLPKRPLALEFEVIGFGSVTVIPASSQARRRREARIERDRALRTFVVDRFAEGWTLVYVAERRHRNCLRVRSLQSVLRRPAL